MKSMVARKSSLLYNNCITTVPKSRIYETMISFVCSVLFVWQKGSEVVENYEKAEKDYMTGMKYKDIAEKYGTTINTVKSWKKRYGWNRKEGAHKKEKVCTQNKRSASAPRVEIDDATKETLQNENLTPEQQMFCIYYSRTFNATQSYQKAYGCSYETALRTGPRLMKNVGVRTEIERLREIKRQQIIMGEDDVVELQMRIAFADMGDYTSFGQERVPVISLFPNMQTNLLMNLWKKLLQTQNLRQILRRIQFKCWKLLISILESPHLKTVLEIVY